MSNFANRGASKTEGRPAACKEVYEELEWRDATGSAKGSLTSRLIAASKRELTVLFTCYPNILDEALTLQLLQHMKSV
jgi:hypothetical protein